MTKKSNPQEIITLANQGNAQSQYELGLMYELGMGIDKDLDRAFIWYQKSANQAYAKHSIIWAFFMHWLKVLIKTFSNQNIGFERPMKMVILVAVCFNKGQ